MFHDYFNFWVSRYRHIMTYPFRKYSIWFLNIPSLLIFRRYGCLNTKARCHAPAAVQELRRVLPHGPHVDPGKPGCMVYGEQMHDFYGNGCGDMMGTYIYIYIHIYVNTHTHIYIYTYVYIYIYIHIHI